MKQIVVTVMGKKYATVPLRDLEAIFLEADVMRLRDEADEGERLPETNP